MFFFVIQKTRIGIEYVLGLIRDKRQTSPRSPVIFSSLCFLGIDLVKDLSSYLGGWDTGSVSLFNDDKQWRIHLVSGGEANCASDWPCGIPTSMTKLSSPGYLLAKH